MPPLIHYTSIKPPTGQEREVFGLQVAIADWLKAYFRYARVEKFLFLIGTKEEWQEVQELAAQAGVDPARLVALDRRFPEQNFSHVSTVFRAEPDTRNLLWQRQLTGNFNFCGLAHAISGVEAGEVLQDYCLAPSHATDAIICPSHAVKSAIHAFWDSYGDYLHKRFGATYRCPVQLPVIPLGIDTEKFAAKTTPDKRAAQREKLGVGENDIIVLWVGRLSAAIKAHPLAMFQAVEKAAIQTGARVHFVMLGYFVPQEAEAQFKKLAADVCVKASVTFIAANDPRFPDGLWAAGDIFLSLTDNMQESFGLTPIEAMAAGLPRVVSDWDGYRDSVKDGEDGFLIRTTQPPAGNGFDLTAQVLSGREVYGGFLAKAALTVAVDAEMAAERLAQLIVDKNLRHAMAEKARARVKAVYDWRHIITAYENLWEALEEQRHRNPLPLEGRVREGGGPQKTPFSDYEQSCHEAGKNPNDISQSPPPLPNPPLKGEGTYRSALPQLPDPYTMYESYPTTRLNKMDRLSLSASIEQIKTLWQHDINTYASDVLIAPQDITALLAFFGENTDATIESAFARFPKLEKPRLWRTLAWLLKLGIVKNSSCQPDSRR
ncbi:MAG: glycosyltransferase family 4 protein [Alphaproteobacteria bacterium]|nr:glycosyltransferase family 4 protein [Alphaproteobacteria bacterium]